MDCAVSISKTNAGGSNWFRGFKSLDAAEKLLPIHPKSKSFHKHKKFCFGFGIPTVRYHRGPVLHKFSCIFSGHLSGISLDIFNHSWHIFWHLVTCLLTFFLVFIRHVFRHSVILSGISSDTISGIFCWVCRLYITYLPHETVAEVSKSKEHTGRRRIQLVRKSIGFKFNCFELELILSFD